jgi:predicted RNA binding protein YcfA (HicA-like mRNA interferase family)
MGKFYNQRELIKVAHERGWTVIDGRGKGSHVWAVKEGERPFPIPQKIKKGLLGNIKKRLDIDD